MSGVPLESVFVPSLRGRFPDVGGRLWWQSGPQSVCVRHSNTHETSLKGRWLDLWAHLKLPVVWATTLLTNYHPDPHLTLVVLNSDSWTACSIRCVPLRRVTDFFNAGWERQPLLRGVSSCLLLRNTFVVLLLVKSEHGRPPPPWPGEGYSHPAPVS